MQEVNEGAELNLKIETLGTKKFRRNGGGLLFMTLFSSLFTVLFLEVLFYFFLAWSLTGYRGDTSKAKYVKKSRIT